MTKLLNTLTRAILFVTICYSLAFCQETLTITTYYPSPYGSYMDIQVAGSLIYTTTQTGDDVRIHSIVQGGGTWLVIRGGADAADNIWIGGDGTPDDTTGTITLSSDTVVVTGTLIGPHVGCRRVAYTTTSGTRQCGDWNGDGDCTDAGESCTSYLSFIPAIGTTYPSTGWYLCCEAQ